MGLRKKNVQGLKRAKSLKLEKLRRYKNIVFAGCKIISPKQNRATFFGFEFRSDGASLAMASQVLSRARAFLVCQYGEPKLFNGSARMQSYEGSGKLLKTKDGSIEKLTKL